ncbi:hypothetical protein VE01_09312 [Pseudogymnoascus verrucosus]|uniref:Mid2 domain-containing protein n=1 Tax=Pseudogymnoascus verrucosus TaxID=342668 RepID=A0A1B8G992_9PEZI|nr:uncharacterized protein VE01_09312 [Pseudogymnoascus verrucosus]OBT92371.1 hypothetical protein VE01_09312 [Pseudogymnoascus verrucosus]
MRSSTLTLASLLSTSHAGAHRPRPVDQSINPRAEYIGGWAWSTTDICSGAWSSSCGTSNNSCCPTGETCFGTGGLPQQTSYTPSMRGPVNGNPPTAATGVCLVADQGVPATEILTAAYRAPNPTRVSDTVIKYPTYTQSGSSSTAISNTTTTTVNNDTSTTNHGVKLSNRSIVGIVIGGIALILALFFSWSVVKRYKLNKAAGTPRFDLPPIIEPPENRPMYVSTGMAYYDSPHGARPEMGNVGSSRYSNSNLASSGYAEGGAPGTATPNGLAQSQAESQQTQTQSPVPASAVPVGPMSPPPLPPYGSPPPPAQYRELHAQAALPGELDSRSAAAGLKRRPVEQGMEGRQELEGGGGQRGGESTAGRMEM